MRQSARVEVGRSAVCAEVRRPRRPPRLPASRELPWLAGPRASVPSTCPWALELKQTGLVPALQPGSWSAQVTWASLSSKQVQPLQQTPSIQGDPSLRQMRSSRQARPLRQVRVTPGKHQLASRTWLIWALMLRDLRLVQKLASTSPARSCYQQARGPSPP